MTDREMHQFKQISDFKNYLKKVRKNSKNFMARADGKLDGVTDELDKDGSNPSDVSSGAISVQAKLDLVLKSHDRLLQQFQEDQQKISEFQSGIVETISRNKAAIENAKKDMESILSGKNEQIESIRQAFIFLTEYLVLVQAENDRLPDPNLDRKMYLINEALFHLVPENSERNKIVNRINKSTDKN